MGALVSVPIDGTAVADCVGGRFVGICVPDTTDGTKVGGCVSEVVEGRAVGTAVVVKADGTTVGIWTPTAEGTAVAVDGDVVGA